MAASIIQYSLTTTQLLQSVTPFFGEPYSYEYGRNMDRTGDVAAKTEARRMIEQSQVVEELPIMFDEDGESSSTATVTTTAALSSNDAAVVTSVDEFEEAVMTES